MPTQNFRRIDLDLLYPPFLAKLLDVIAACNDRGVIYVALRGYDTYGAQMALWAQGRTKAGKVVTNAKGGQSQHNFGLAVDFAAMVNGKLTWDPEAYRVLVEEVEKAGLHSGASYKDLPHVGWPGWVNATQLKPLDEKWRLAESGDTLETLKEVWKVLERR